ncbi:MAG: hypothetical protein U5K43_10025 [Halofilum sp. (in: g-proteobacteria)]|nr:hypothetical protein [Halofilum sp. (in: g-proteobacteria)]
MTTEDQPDDKRRRRMHAIGRTVGKQFRKGGPGREAAKRVGGTAARRGLWRLIRRF